MLYSPQREVRRGEWSWMAFAKTRRALTLTAEERERLRTLTKSRKASGLTQARARILLGFADRRTLAAIAQESGLSLAAVNRCVDKALAYGVETALTDLPRSGRPPRIPPEARLWIVEMACRKPTELGYPHEQWTIELLAKHVRTHAGEANFPSLSHAGKSLVHDILAQQEIQPHRIKYYLERRDSAFDEKKAMILMVYQEVALQQAERKKRKEERRAEGGREQGGDQDLAGVGPDAGPLTVTVCVDEKPGCQALRNSAPDLAPQPGRYATWARDHEYKRLGTMSLLTGLDLLTGHVHGLVRGRHRSAEFVELLTALDSYYPASWTIRVICDNHSAHVSKETKRYLSKHTGRFNFVFTPVHGSWLNLIEVLFSKMSRSVLRGMRVQSKEEFADRIRQYWDLLNTQPVQFHWKYGLDDLEQLTFRSGPGANGVDT